MAEENLRVCPVELAGSLDKNWRKWIHNPVKIFRPYLREGMNAIDLGCGPGFFTIEMARMVGKTGKVIAADLQQGMLEIIRKKINGTEYQNRIILHKCEENLIGLTEKVDFALAFYMIHEIPDKVGLFNEVKSFLNPKGFFLIVEPKIHVNKNAFNKTIQIAVDAGFEIIENPKIFFSRSALIRKTK